jgi:PAS domain S-box-containing protein
VKPGLVRPSGVERTFGADEIIVTKTDPRGVITCANQVFLRVSAYDEADVIGQPHNLIRHPDMPRTVFKLLWDTIRGGQEMFAYIVNLAADGAHYWVFAHVTPSFGRTGGIVGYHSNRRVPDRSAVREAAALYARLRAEETRHPRVADAIDASSRLLADVLAERGQTYDEFVWSLAGAANARDPRRAA